MVPVIRDAGSLVFDAFLAAYDALVEKARTNTLIADDLVGANITLTNPGGLGTVASVPRLLPGQGTIVATGSIAYPVGLGEIAGQIGAEKVMTLTSTYDHRVIQGAQSGQFLARIDELLAGADSFYEEIFAALGTPLPPLPARTTPAVGAAASVQPSEELLQAAATANALVRSLRTHGHLAASLDPLGSPPQGDPALDPQAIGLTTGLMTQIPSKILHIFVPGETLAEAFPQLRDTYCGTIAYQIEHMSSHQQRRWLREKIEGGAFRRPLDAAQQRALLKRLIEVDALERFMHRAYLGQHQFSIEGVDMTVPMLDEMIRLSAGGGAREVVIGMAHRGRLNVLAHNLGRPYETIFAEFEGASTLEAVTTIPQGGTGDVKYHHGAQGSYELADGSSIMVNLESNPSHLEYVCPVVMGATRAAQSSFDGPRSDRDTTSAVPIMIHGDAAFPGQGVVAETLNLQTLDGYSVGGTLHLITNNQTGFTTDPDDARSTHWASDLAKGFDIPIIHVNADDVEACIAAVKLAFAYRETWGHDVLIDLIGYRRFGHNESDEPAYTQPEMYATIAGKKRVWELWADDLISRKVITPAEVDQEREHAWNELTRRHQELQDQIAQLRESGSAGPHTGEYELDRSASPEVDTTVPAELLREIDHNLLRVPRGLQRAPEARAPDRAPPRRARRRDRLGPRRGARVRLAAFRGDADPPDRPGHRARHLQPAPPRPARRHQRPDAVPDRQPAQLARALRAPQQPALGDRLPRLRVRLQPGVAGDARALGGAVRRLRERRPGDRRPVHRLRPREMGAELTPDAAACRTATRDLGRSTPRRGSSASSRSPPRATSASPTRRRRPSTTTCCAARRGSSSSGR